MENKLSVLGCYVKFCGDGVELSTMCAFVSLFQKYDFADGSLSDTAVVTMIELDVPSEKSKRKDSQRDRNRDRQDQMIGLGKKSSSTSQLSATGRFIYLF